MKRNVRVLGFMRCLCAMLVAGFCCIHVTSSAVAAEGQQGTLTIDWRQNSQSDCAQGDVLWLSWVLPAADADALLQDSLLRCAIIDKDQAQVEADCAFELVSATSIDSVLVLCAVSPRTTQHLPIGMYHVAIELTHESGSLTSPTVAITISAARTKDHAVTPEQRMRLSELFRVQGQQQAQTIMGNAMQKLDAPLPSGTSVCMLRYYAMMEARKAAAKSLQSHERTSNEHVLFSLESRLRSALETSPNAH